MSDRSLPARRRFTRPLLTAAVAAVVAGCASGTSTDGDSAAENLTADAPTLEAAYTWGYPLVVNERTFQMLGGILGVNSLFNQPVLQAPTPHFIVAPNHDTLYSAAVLDLRSEPMVLTLPDVGDRYWVAQFIDAWTNTFFYAGTRATAGKGGKFAITAPGWTGTLPEGVTAVRSSTPQAFILARYLVKDDADIPTVHAIPRTLQGLHVLTGAAAPPPPPPMGRPLGTPQSVGSDGAHFFDELGDALATNPPATDDDRAELAKVASLGIGPGLHPAAAAGADSGALAALSDAVTHGNQDIANEAMSVGTPKNGWNAELEVTATPSDPLLRAAIAEFLWGANVPEEAVYAVARKDAAGQPLTGASSYVLHMSADQRPPVGAQGFWSITMYGPDMFFVPNSANRYSISDRTPNLALNPDGSLDVFIQPTPPQGHESNWLPSPSGPFVLTTRLYLPQASVIDGTYAYPSVTATLAAH